MRPYYAEGPIEPVKPNHKKEKKKLDEDRTQSVVRVLFMVV